MEPVTETVPAQPAPAAENVSQATPNFGLAIAGGLGAAILGAAAWTVVTVVTQMELGIMAVAIGFLVGWAVRELGKGSDQKFGVVGAVCGLFGCVLGNALSALAFFSQAKGLPFLSVVANANPNFIVSLMTAFFSPMDLLFYAIAVYEAYKFSLRKARS
jgi:uncharacterized membrane protein YeaQ/YmgE (transglycosylase-associated protein family)